MTEDLKPFLLCRPDGQSAQCATWRLEVGGHQSLVFFSSPEAAEHYRRECELDDAWVVRQPARRALAQILHNCLSDQSIQYAVLDPSKEAARRVFELRPMMEQIESELGE